MGITGDHSGIPHLTPALSALKGGEGARVGISELDLSRHVLLYRRFITGSRRPLGSAGPRGLGRCGKARRWDRAAGGGWPGNHIEIAAGHEFDLLLGGRSTSRRHSDDEDRKCESRLWWGGFGLRDADART